MRSGGGPGPGGDAGTARTNPGQERPEAVRLRVDEREQKSDLERIVENLAVSFRRETPRLTLQMIT